MGAVPDLQFQLLAEIEPGMCRVNIICVVLEVNTPVSPERPLMCRLSVADASARMTLFVMDRRGLIIELGDLLRIRHGHLFPWRDHFAIFVGRSSDMNRVGEVFKLRHNSGPSGQPTLSPCLVFFETGENGYSFCESFKMGCGHEECRRCRARPRRDALGSELQQLVDDDELLGN